MKFPFSKGEKIQISGENEVSRGRVFPSWAYPVGGGLIVAGLAFILIKYRKSKVVKALGKAARGELLFPPLAKKAKVFKNN
ncbi:MAG: hypothetical protein ACOX5S_04150 [Patescibacteria group bacterium]